MTPRSPGLSLITRMVLEDLRAAAIGGPINLDGRTWRPVNTIFLRDKYEAYPGRFLTHLSRLQEAGLYRPPSEEEGFGSVCMDDG